MNAEIVYSVGPHCTNLSTQQPMEDYSIDQSEADTVLFTVYAALWQSGYSGPVVIDAADTDVYITASSHSSSLACFASKEKKKQSSVVAC